MFLNFPLNYFPYYIRTNTDLIAEVSPNGHLQDSVMQENDLDLK